MKTDKFLSVDLYCIFSSIYSDIKKLHCMLA